VWLDHLVLMDLHHLLELMLVSVMSLQICFMLLVSHRATLVILELLADVAKKEMWYVLISLLI